MSEVNEVSTINEEKNPSSPTLQENQSSIENDKSFLIKFFQKIWTLFLLFLGRKPN